MRALTLWRPWTDAILRRGKRVENRRRPPPRGTVGTTIALHAGKRYEIGDWSFSDSWTPPRDEDCSTGIVGVARIAGYLDLRNVDDEGRGRRSESVVEESAAARVHSLDLNPWWTGPCGWLLDHVVAIGEPIPCRGAQGLWTVPALELEFVKARLRALL